MENFTASPLFRGIPESELRELFSCLQPQRRVYEKGARLFSAGDTLPAMGLVLSGAVDLADETVWGDRRLIARVNPMEVFGESFAGREEQLPFSITAAERSEVLLLGGRALQGPCGSGCRCHVRLTQNLIEVLTQKNAGLMRKITLLTRKTTREKLLSYLSEQARLSGSATFRIPLNRQELADYLSVERSAMCRALGDMREEGLLSYSRQNFTLNI